MISCVVCLLFFIIISDGKFKSVELRGFLMKKSYLLSGMLILVSGVVAYAMEPARPREFRMIDMALAKHDWHTIFDLLEAVPGLVDAYETPRAYTLLYYTIRQSDFLKAKILLEKYGADLNRTLYLAVFDEDIPMIKFLLEHGANPDESRKEGMTARKLALMQRNSDVLEVIESFDRK